MKVEDLGFGIPILCRLSILAPCVNCILRQFDQFPESTLGISGWGCAAGTLEPLTYTRATSAEFCYPILE